MFARPEPDQLAFTYQRLVAGDTTAREKLVQLTFDPLIEVLRFRKEYVRDPDIIHDAVVDAIMDLLRSPQSYQATQSSLWSFLEMAARRNLADRRLSERRRYRRIARFRKNVALSSLASNKNRDKGGLVGVLVDRETSKALWRRVICVIDSMSPTEVEVFKLMISGVRATSEYTRVLGMDVVAPGEQAVAVKRVKDRVRKRLRRLLRITLPCDS
jgi:DNA-directed RNA polymerase specialized sigma24 family protein